MYPPRPLRQNYSEAGLAVSNAPHAGNVHSAFPQSPQAGLREQIASHAELKPT